MPRDGAGLYSLPAGNPVVTNTVIASAWANTTMSDIAAQLNNVLTRDGLLGPTGPFKIQDGTVAAPGLAFNSEPGLGWYRRGAGIVGFATAGAVIGVFGSDGGGASLSVFPRANGQTTISLSNQPSGAANANYFQLVQSAGGSVTLATVAAGSATRGNLTLDAPIVAATGALRAGINSQLGFVGSSSNLSPTQLFFADYAVGGTVRYDITSNADLGGGNVLTISSHDPGVKVWYEIRIANSKSYQFDGGGNASKDVGGAWVAFSDARIKTAIEDYAPGLAEVIQLRPRTFAFRTATGRSAEGKRYTSLIAQEAEAVMPDLVTNAPGEVGDIKLADMRTLDITNITYALVNSVKTLNARLAALEAA